MAGVRPLIDTTVLVWGEALGSVARRGRSAALLREPVYLDWADLLARLGGDDGRLRSIRYSEHRTIAYGRWKIGAVEFMYRDGRVEARTSLPKLLTGRNDVLLSEAGVHDALRELAARASELAGVPLGLRDATPTRLDYVFQWDVPSVAAVLEHLRGAYHPARKLRTENVATHGGRSLSFGYGTKQVRRFYDKGAEVAEQEARDAVTACTPPGFEAMTPAEQKRALAAARRKAREKFWAEADIDTKLRFEIQERRRPLLRVIHEAGYRGEHIRTELVRALDPIACVAGHDLATLIDAERHWSNGTAYLLASLYALEHPEALVAIRNAHSRPAYYKWRKRMAKYALALGTWAPAIPEGVFGSGPGLWDEQEASAA